MTADLVAFLNARLDEDERMARGATPGPWAWETFHGVDELVHPGPSEPPSHGTNVLKASHEDWPPKLADAAHIARHNPARVLAEVAAKRDMLARILAEPHYYLDEDAWYSCSQAVNPSNPEDGPGGGCIDDSRAGKPCDCGLDSRRKAWLDLLARPYADRLDPS